MALKDRFRSPHSGFPNCRSTLTTCEIHEPMTTSTLGIPAEKRIFFLNLSYACLEPVLVNRSLSALKSGSNKDVFAHRSTVGCT